MQPFHQRYRVLTNAERVQNWLDRDFNLYKNVDWFKNEFERPKKSDVIQMEKDVFKRIDKRFTELGDKNS